MLQEGGDEDALAMLALAQLLSRRPLSATTGLCTGFGVPTAWTALPPSFTVRAQLGITSSDRPSSLPSLCQAPLPPALTDPALLSMSPPKTQEEQGEGWCLSCHLEGEGRGLTPS